MMGSVTYLAKTGERINLKRIGEKLDLCRPLNGNKVCGTHQEFHITIFKDGEIWLEIPLQKDKKQSEQLMKASNFLTNAFQEQDINLDFANLLLNAKTIKTLIPPSQITHSNPQNFRPQLKHKTHLNLFRLLTHWVLYNETGENWKKLTKKFGIHLGALAQASLSSKIKDEESAIQTLNDFLKNNGIGRIEKIKPINDERLRIKMEESLTSSGIQKSDEKLCYLEAGILQGFLSKFYEQPMKCEEEKCWSLGNQQCEFSLRVDENAEQ